MDNRRRALVANNREISIYFTKRLFISYVTTDSDSCQDSTFLYRVDGVDVAQERERN